MNNSRFLLLVSLSVIVMCPSAGQAENEAVRQLLYLASTREKAIDAYEIAAKTGKLTKRFRVALPGNLGPMAFSPNRDYLYAALTGLADSPAGVATLKRAPNGQLQLVKTVPIVTRAPYIRADHGGRVLLAAHYGSGEVTVYRIQDGICTGELLDRRETEKTAHCIEVDRSNRFAFVPHTTPNKVYQFRLDPQTGKLTPNQPPFVSGPDTEHLYHEPRHFLVHPKNDQLAFTSNERGGGISSWRLDPDAGTLTLLHTLNTLPPNFTGQSAAADLKLSADGRFAYVSNRDLTDRPGQQQDSLAAVAVNAQTGQLEILGHAPTVHFPRATCLDESGRFFFAAGQKSDSLAVYRVGMDGRLTHLETVPTAGVPIWVMCAETR